MSPLYQDLHHIEVRVFQLDAETTQVDGSPTNQVSYNLKLVKVAWNDFIPADIMQFNPCQSKLGFGTGAKKVAVCSQCVLGQGWCGLHFSSSGEGLSRIHV